MAVLAVLSLLAGCGDSQHPHAASPTVSASPRAPVSGTTRATSSFRFTTVDSATIAAADVGPLSVSSLDGGTVIAPIARQRGGNWNVVEAMTAHGRKPRVVARSQWPRGLINWAVVTGDWVAWSDQSAAQGDGVDDVLWRVHAINLRTGQT